MGAAGGALPGTHDSARSNSICPCPFQSTRQTRQARPGDDRESTEGDEFHEKVTSHARTLSYYTTTAPPPAHRHRGYALAAARYLVSTVSSKCFGMCSAARTHHTGRHTRSSRGRSWHGRQGRSRHSPSKWLREMLPKRHSVSAKSSVVSADG